MIPKLITYQEAEDRYRCDRQSIRKAILDGRIVAYKPGKAVLIDLASGDEWFMSTRQAPLVKIGRPRRGSRR